jgi:MFS superfamily sulfate permease-like transporter
VDESGTRYASLKEHPDYSPVDPGLIIFRFDAPLIFSNADEFCDQIMCLVDEAILPPRRVIIDGEDMFDIDTTGAGKFIALQSGLASQGISLSLARVHVPTLEAMRREGVIDAVGEENVFITVHDAVQAFRDHGTRD